MSCPSLVSLAFASIAASLWLLSWVFISVLFSNPFCIRPVLTVFSATRHLIILANCTCDIHITQLLTHDVAILAGNHNSHSTRSQTHRTSVRRFQSKPCLISQGVQSISQTLRTRLRRGRWTQTACSISCLRSLLERAGSNKLRDRLSQLLSVRLSSCADSGVLWWHICCPQEDM